MAALPTLRRNLDLTPSPVPDRPGLLLRDPFGYTEQVLILPPPLIACLAFFDGDKSELDLREAVVRAAGGDVRAGELVRQLVSTLAEGGFLENEVYAGLRDARHRAFAAAERREPAHAGSAYPADAAELSRTLERYLDGSGAGTSPDLVGIAAPHVSPEGGWRCYRAAYGALDTRQRERTFVVLGTSHYGEPGRFGLTRKPFLTPLGEAAVDRELVDRLAAEGGEAAVVEDYCHCIEHSIEFQVVFLQHLFGPGVRILPVLCGPFDAEAERPESDAGVARFLDALAALAAREAGRLVFVLGVDMAHMGRRYGDGFGARAERDAMREVAERDKGRIERVIAGDASGFWALVREGGGDDLRWCGSSPLYAFLRALPGVRGSLLCYEQWNIDAASVVSFAGLAFRRSRQEKGES